MGYITVASWQIIQENKRTNLKPKTVEFTETMHEHQWTAITTLVAAAEFILWQADHACRAAAARLGSKPAVAAVDRRDRLTYTRPFYDA